MPPTLTGVHSTHERPASLKSFWACFALFFVAGTFLLVTCYAIHSVYRSAKVDEDPRMRHKGSEIEKKEVVPEKERPKRSFYFCRRRKKTKNSLAYRPSYLSTTSLISSHSPNLSSASLPPSPIPTVYDPTTPTFDRNNIPFFIPPEQLAELPIDPKLAPIGGSFEFVPPSPVTTVSEVEAMPGLVTISSSPRFSSGPGTVKYNSEHGQDRPLEIARRSFVAPKHRTDENTMSMPAKGQTSRRHSSIVYKKTVSPPRKSVSVSLICRGPLYASDVNACPPPRTMKKSIWTERTNVREQDARKTQTRRRSLTFSEFAGHRGCG